MPMEKQEDVSSTRKLLLSVKEMSDFELALWSLSSEERVMLKRYALHYCREYGDGQVQLEKAESLSSIERGVEDSSFHNPLPQTEQGMIFSKSPEILVC
jgi:hypothetical protein